MHGGNNLLDDKKAPRRRIKGKLEKSPRLAWTSAGEAGAWRMAICAITMSFHTKEVISVDASFGGIGLLSRCFLSGLLIVPAKKHGD